jgi:hypothetical protein
MSSLRSVLTAAALLGCVASCSDDSASVTPAPNACLDRACSFDRGTSTLADVEDEMGMPIEHEQSTGSGGVAIDVLHYRCGQQAFAYSFEDEVLADLNAMGWGADLVAACLGEADADAGE